jgi:hypothetical protein
MKFPFSLFEKKSGDNAATPVAKPSTISPGQSPADILSPPPVERASFQVPGELTSPPSPQVGSAPNTVSSSVAAQVLSVSEAMPGAIADTADAADVTDVPAQMETNLMTSEDIIAAYKIFLRRRPENMDGVTPRVGLTSDRILFDYLMSDEFTARPEVAQLVFNCAKKILDAKKVSDAASSATGAEVAPAAEESSEPTPGFSVNKAPEA